MNERVLRLQHFLREQLQAAHVEVADDSAKHVGHAGAAAGGHYTITIVSTRFHGLTPLQRHRLIYQALGDLSQKDIHALSIRAMTPDEAR